MDLAQFFIHSSLGYDLPLYSPLPERYLNSIWTLCWTAPPFLDTSAMAVNRLSIVLSWQGKGRR
jgi:hypothetical protein